jgi:hypothetical protein
LVTVGIRVRIPTGPAPIGNGTDPARLVSIGIALGRGGGGPRAEADAAPPWNNCTRALDAMNRGQGLNLGVWARRAEGFVFDERRRDQLEDEGAGLFRQLRNQLLDIWYSNARDHVVAGASVVCPIAAGDHVAETGTAKQGVDQRIEERQ